MCSGSLLIGIDLRQGLREVCLHDLQESDDAAGRTLGRVERLAILGVVVTQDLQSRLDSRDALLQLCLASPVGRLPIPAQHVHAGLGLGKLRELVLQSCYLLLQCSCSTIDPGADLLDLIRLVRLIS